MVEWLCPHWGGVSLGTRRRVVAVHTWRGAWCSSSAAVPTLCPAGAGLGCGSHPTGADFNCSSPPMEQFSNKLQQPSNGAVQQQTAAAPHWSACPSLQARTCSTADATARMTTSRPTAASATAVQQGCSSKRVRGSSYKRVAGMHRSQAVVPAATCAQTLCVRTTQRSEHAADHLVWPAGQQAHHAAVEHLP